MEKHLVETEFQQKYGNTGEPICPTDYTDGSSKYGRNVPQAWKDANIVTIYKKETKQNVVITEVYVFFLQPARSLIGSY